ncbi:MAG: hypothetical protein ACKO96_27080, partial [Flammeovirgaceae bacterium]
HMLPLARIGIQISLHSDLDNFSIRGIFLSWQIDELLVNLFLFLISIDFLTININFYFIIKHKRN